MRQPQGIAHRTRWIAPLILVALGGCLETDLEGELLLDPMPSSFTETRFVVALWRYESILADTGVEQVAETVIEDADSSPVSFSIATDAPEEGFDYYLVVHGDMDGDGERSDGDYYQVGRASVDTSDGSWSFTSVTISPVDPPIGCETARQHTERFADSLRAWQDLKSSSGSRYSYSTEWHTWNERHGYTDFVVEGDVVIRRSFQLWDRDGVLVEDWVEEGDELGSHIYGADPVRTLDEVYDDCCADTLAQDPEFNTLTFEADDVTSLLQTCVYVPIGCVDDCTFGTTLSEVVFDIEAM